MGAFLRSACLVFAIVICSVMSAPRALADASQLLWATRAGGTGMDHGFRLKAHPDGGVLTSGFFRNQATFGAGEPNATILSAPSGQPNLYLARYDNDGSLIWVKQAGGPNDDQPFAIDLMPDGGCVVTGYFYTRTTFGNGELNETSLDSGGGYDLFVARFDDNGSLLWARRAGGPGSEAGRSIRALPDGGFLVSGWCAAGAVFGPGELYQTTLSSGGSFLAKYADNGDFLWVRSNSASSAYLGALPDGSSIVASSFTGSVTLGSGEPNQTTLTALSGGTDLFSARFDPDGQLVWVKHAGRMGGNLQPWGIEVLSNGAATVVGSLTGSAAFGQGEEDETDLLPIGGAGGFIARFNPDGSLNWARAEGGAIGESAVARANGKTIVTGFFGGTATFGWGEPHETSLVSAGGFDVFLAEYDADGDFEWARREGGPAQDIAFDLALVGPSDVIVNGWFGATAVFGQGEPEQISLGSAGDVDVFAARYTFIEPVEVLYPNGGEVLQVGSQIGVQWKIYVPAAGTAVKLELWNAAGRVADLGYGGSPTGAGETLIYVPPVPEGSDYRLRAISTWNPSLMDESDADFAIAGRAVNVLAPNGGEVWPVGSAQQIHWRTSLVFAGSAVRLEILRFGRPIVDLGATSALNGDGIFAWQVPALPPGTGYQVRATSLWDPSLDDVSDGYWTVFVEGAVTAADGSNWTPYR